VSTAVVVLVGGFAAIVGDMLDVTGEFLDVIVVVGVVNGGATGAGRSQTYYFRSISPRRGDLCTAEGRPIRSRGPPLTLLRGTPTDYPRGDTLLQ
jgi:hypothetical protein